MKSNGYSVCDQCKHYLSSDEKAPDYMLCTPCEVDALKSALRGLLDAYPMSKSLKQTEAVIAAHHALGTKMYGD